MSFDVLGDPCSLGGLLVLGFVPSIFSMFVSFSHWTSDLLCGFLYEFCFLDFVLQIIIHKMEIFFLKYVYINR